MNNKQDEFVVFTRRAMMLTAILCAILAITATALAIYSYEATPSVTKVPVYVEINSMKQMSHFTYKENLLFAPVVFSWLGLLTLVCARSRVRSSVEGISDHLQEMRFIVIGFCVAAVVIQVFCLNVVVNGSLAAFELTK